MQINTQLLSNFPPTTPKEIQTFTQYLQTAPIAEGHWQVLKGVYKKLEAEPIGEPLATLITRLDATKFTALGSKYPQAATLGYMKRRARRYLRQLGEKSPNLYAQICMKILEKQQGKTDLDFHNQWVVIDIILGNSNRFEQTRNGRGKIAAIPNSRNIYRSEERFPAIWNEHLWFVEKLLQTDKLSAFIYEFAVKVLLRNKKAIPSLSLAQYKTFFQSNSTWLQSIAANEIFQRFENHLINDPELIAYTIFYSSKKQRQKLLKAFVSNASKTEDSLWKKVMQSLSQKEKSRNFSEEWKQTFIQVLGGLIFKQVAQNNFSSRVKDSIEVLLEFKEYIPYQYLVDNAQVLLNNSNKKLQNLALLAAEKAPRTDIVKWLSAVEEEQTELIEKLYDIFAKKHKKSEKLRYNYFDKFIYNDKRTVFNFGWHLISKRGNTQSLTQHFWGRMYWRNWSYLPYRYMIQSPVAAKLLLKYAKDRLQWMMWYKGNCIKVIQEATPELSAHMLEKVKNAAVSNRFTEWLPYIAELTEQREDILLELLPKIKKRHIDRWDIVTGFTQSNEWVRKIIWQLMYQFQYNSEAVSSIVYRLVNHYSNESVERFISEVYEKEDPQLETWLIGALKEILQDYPQYINKFARLFDQIAVAMPAENMLTIIKTSNEENWQSIQQEVVKYAGGANGQQFWMKVLEKLPEETNNTLQNRLLENEEMLNTFYQIDTVDVLEAKHPAFGDLLFNWIQKHEKVFAANSYELLTACKHPIVKVRNWALKRAKSLGLNMRFSLQLMEAGLPDVFALGRGFFEVLPKGSEEEFEGILAMCDSPQQPVREFGIQFLQKRQANITSDLALAYLSEHSDTTVQAFVAKKLAEQVEQKEELGKEVFVQKFDKSLLRTRNRSRKAKELVKKRVGKNLVVDPKTLLEVARSNNQKDAEWAIQQLTKLALAGESVEGFELT